MLPQKSKVEAEAFIGSGLSQMWKPEGQAIASELWLLKIQSVAHWLSL
jgi:hypothetical protein